MGSFPGMELIRFMQSGWTKARDTGVALHIRCRRKATFLQKVTNLTLLFVVPIKFQLRGSLSFDKKAKLEREA
jgi:hypothetical protein